MVEPIWWWSAAGSAGWAEQEVPSGILAIADSIAQEVSPWTNNRDPAFAVWVDGSQLVCLVTDLLIRGKDHAGRPLRARCLVVAEPADWGSTMAKVAALVRDGLPEGYVISVPVGESDPLGFRVSASELPRLVPSRGTSASLSLPRNDWQRCFVEPADAAEWMAALAEDPEALRNCGPRVVIGSPLMNEETREHASSYSAVVGPGLVAGDHPKGPGVENTPDEEHGLWRRYWAMGLTFLFLAVVALIWLTYT